MIVIIVNGRPQCGKDTFIETASLEFDCYHHSTIDACKVFCDSLGWDGKKDDKSRKMLSDIKKWYIEYFDGPFNDFKDDFDWCMKSETQIMFAVSRESDEIKRIAEYSWHDRRVNCHYIFVERNNNRDNFGNDSDDKCSEGYKPDIFLHNNGTLAEFKKNSVNLIYGLLETEQDI